MTDRELGYVTQQAMSIVTFAYRDVEVPSAEELAAQVVAVRRILCAGAE